MAAVGPVNPPAYSDSQARRAISENIIGLEYDNATGQFSLTSGYQIPTDACLMEAAQAYQLAVAHEANEANDAIAYANANSAMSRLNNGISSSSFTADGNTFSVSSGLITGMVTDNNHINVERLISRTLVDMNAVGNTALFTVPSDCNLLITKVTVHHYSASLFGGTNYSITNYRQNFNLGLLINPNTGYGVILPTGASSALLYSFSLNAPSTIVYLTVTQGAPAPVTAYIDLFGYLIR